MKKSIYTSNYEIFRGLLRMAREERGLTQADLALRLNETQTFISKCERGERRLDIIELRSWCAALDISFADFVSLLDRLCMSYQ